MKQVLTFIGLCVCAVFVCVSRVSAEGGNALTISPAQLDIEIATTDVKKTAQFTITNTYNVPVQLSVELKGIDQVSGRIIPGDTFDQSLAAATEFSSSIVDIPEQSTAFVALEITNTSELSPGGHYGTVVFTQLRSAEGDINFTQGISAGLFVVKRGGQLREIDASHLVLNSLPLQLPSTATVDFLNVGNVHTIPRAAVLVYGSDGELVAKGIANTDSRRILPGKELKDTFSIIQSGRLWWPQKLRIVFEYRADGIEESKRIERSVYYVPSYVVIALGLLAIAVTMFVRTRLNRKKSVKFAQQDRPVMSEDANSTSPSAEQTTHNKNRSKKHRKIHVTTLEP